MMEAKDNSLKTSDNKENEMDCDIKVPLLGKATNAPKALYEFKPFTFKEINTNSKLKKPDPRSGHRIVCSESVIYSLGGYLEIEENSSRNRRSLSIGEKKVFKELYKFNFCYEQWKKVATKGKFPVGLVSHTAALHGNYLIVYGGTSLPFGEISSDSVDICNLNTKTWTELTTYGQTPGGIYGHSMIVDEVNKCVYIVGGTTGFRFFIDIHKLDLISGQWEPLFISQGDILQTGEPSPRYRHETAFDGTLIYVVGGGRPTCTENLASIPVFNITTRAWSTKETIGDDIHQHPSSRKCHGLIQTKDNIWMSGGENGIDLFNEFWNLHLPTMKWTMISTRIPMELSFHSANITPQGCMYIFGGVNKVNQDRRGAVFKDRTNTIFKMWLTIPTLKEMCWEALLHYDNSIKHLSPDQLIVKGIPREFVARLYA